MSAAAVQPPVAIVVPGRPVVSELQCVDGARWIAPLGNAPETFAIFLTSPFDFPPGVALGIYLAREEDGAFAYIGSLLRSRPSAILRVPAAFFDVHFPVRVVLGISQEREEDVVNLGTSPEESVEQGVAATKVALSERIVEDLYNFVVSHARVLSSDPNDPQSEEMVYMPASFVNRWRERVLAKIRKDVSFWN